MSATGPETSPRAAAPRYFGRRQLLRLLGKSQHTMSWLVADADGRELVLVLPRVAPAGRGALERWHQATRRATRLVHPQLAQAVDIGVQDGWPFVAYDLGAGATLADRLSKRGLPGAEAASIAVQVLRGLAYAHEAGVTHGDIQTHMVIVDDNSQARLLGLEVACESPAAHAAIAATMATAGASHAGSSTHLMGTQRLQAERDVLATGLVLHGLLAGSPALDEPDVSLALARLPPLGREIIRLPWTGAHPVAEPLRVIVNRATDRQERQRYRSARTLLRALEGWLQTESKTGGGVLALLADKLRTAGVLPAAAGAAGRAARLAMMERERTNELAEVVLEDLALSFELLRAVNTAQVRGSQISGSGAVLTVRRAISMIGLDGVRRATLGLRAWPGPLQEAGAAELEQLLVRCKRAARVAMALRPPAYDGEVVYLITLLQNLGRLVVHYHFAEEAQQIRRLMQPAPAGREGEAADPGMSEEAAAYAVLGADIEAMGQAVARWWGLEETVLAMIRKPAANAPVHPPSGDEEMLRLIGACANEALDAATLPAGKALVALQRVVQRYGRVLGIGLRELQEALAPRDSAERIAVTAPMPLDMVTDSNATTGSAAQGSLRAAAAQRGAGATPGATRVHSPAR